MGIKLTSLINKKEINFEDLIGKKVAIDASNMLYQFLASIRQADGTLLMDSKGRPTSHLVGIFSRLSNLMEKGIKICVCFDGKPPMLKVAEREEREHKKRVAEEKFLSAKEEENVENMLKYSKQMIRLTWEMIDESKELISAMGMPVIQAPSESDAQISYMCRQGDVDYIASSDMDCLLYGAPKIITNLTLSQKKKLPKGGYVRITPELIVLKNVLEDLGINQDQLIVIGILVGTDYNEGIFKIGPKTALKLVKQYKNFDELFKEVKAEFNWKQVYAIYKSMPVMENYQLKWKDVDEERIKKLLIDKHEFQEERVESTLAKLRKREKGQNGLGKWV